MLRYAEAVLHPRRASRSAPQLRSSGQRKAKPLGLPYASLPMLFVSFDIVLIAASALLADFGYHYLTYKGPGDSQLSLGVGLVAAGLFAGIMQSQKMYQTLRTERLRMHMRAASTRWVVVFAGLSCILFLMKMGDVVSRGFLISFFGVGLCALLAWRILLKRMYRRLVVAGTLAGPRVIVIAEYGRGETDQQLSRLERYGYRLSRLFFLPSVESGEKENTGRVKHILQAVIRHVREQQVDEILVVASWARFAASGEIQAALRMVPVPVKLVADSDLAHMLSFTACEIGSSRAILLKPASLSRLQRLSKRSLDIIASAILLAALAPIFIVVGMVIKLDSAGPVFFRQWRGGYNGRKFRIFKFRTMTVQEDGDVVLQARNGDSRVTLVGRFLRKSSIDELPQLLNVILGDMSLVGPRPHAIAHDKTYSRLIGPYPARHNVKPGITGWAQVSGCRGETADVNLMKKRIDHDLTYIQQWSLLLDVGIILMTIREVMLPRNAH